MVSYLKLSKFFLYLVPFTVIIVSRSTLFPFIVGKYVFFRVVVELALLSFLWAWAFGAIAPARIHADSHADKRRNISVNPRNNQRESAFNWQQPIVITISLFVLIFLLAGFFGVNPKYSFWSNFERGEGGFQMLHFFVFFILLVLTFKDEKDWRRLFIVSLWAAGLMIGYGLAAALKINGFIGPGICDRFQGSLGNPAYVGTYLIFSLFYTGYLLTTEKQKSKKWLWLGLLIFFSFFLLLTQTRGAFMGLGIGLIVFSFYLAIALPPGWFRKFSLASGIFLVLLGSSIVIFRPSINPLPFCSSASRLLEISLYDPSSQPRLWTWKSAIKGFKEYSIFGWGPENFSVVFDKYFDTRHYIPGNPNSQTWFDRAHSIFLDYLSQTGILGLMSFLSIWFAFYWQFFKKTQRDTNKNTNKHESKKQLTITGQQLIFQNALLFALPIAYLVQGLVLFDVLPIYLNLFLFLAFAVYKFQASSAK